jgi:hypothetical protein
MTVTPGREAGCMRSGGRLRRESWYGRCRGIDTATGERVYRFIVIGVLTGYGLIVGNALKRGCAIPTGKQRS